MLKTKKKGFTIVELVIVIAVIAILAAVLIPTFATVIKNAEQSTALQACKSASTEYLSEQMQANPGKTAQEILRNKYFAYDVDTTDTGITVGSYKFYCDSEGKQLIAATDNDGKVTTQDDWSIEEIIEGSNVYMK